MIKPRSLPQLNVSIFITFFKYFRARYCTIWIQLIASSRLHNLEHNRCINRAQYPVLPWSANPRKSATFNRNSWYRDNLMEATIIIQRRRCSTFLFFFFFSMKTTRVQTTKRGACNRVIPSIVIFQFLTNIVVEFRSRASRKIVARSRGSYNSEGSARSLRFSCDELHSEAIFNR